MDPAHGVHGVILDILKVLFIPTHLTVIMYLYCSAFYVSAYCFANIVSVLGGLCDKGLHITYIFVFSSL